MSISIYAPTAIDAASMADIRWDGSESTDWNTAGNWVGDAVPTANDQAIIPDATTTSNDPVISSGTVSVLRITVEAGGVLSISSGATLAIDVQDGGVNGINNHGTITNEGTITIDNIGDSWQRHGIYGNGSSVFMNQNGGVINWHNWLCE